MATTTQITTIDTTIPGEWYGDFADHYDTAAVQAAYTEAVNEAAREIVSSIHVAANGQVFADVDDADAARDIDWRELMDDIALAPIADRFCTVSAKMTELTELLDETEIDYDLEDGSEMGAGGTFPSVICDSNGNPVNQITIEIPGGARIIAGPSDRTAGSEPGTPPAYGFDVRVIFDGPDSQHADDHEWFETAGPAAARITATATLTTVWSVDGSDENSGPFWRSEHGLVLDHCPTVDETIELVSGMNLHEAEFGHRASTWTGHGEASQLVASLPDSPDLDMTLVKIVLPYGVGVDAAGQLIDHSTGYRPTDERLDEAFVAPAFFA